LNLFLFIYLLIYLGDRFDYFVCPSWVADMVCGQNDQISIARSAYTVWRNVVVLLVVRC